MCGNGKAPLGCSPPMQLLPSLSTNISLHPGGSPQAWALRLSSLHVRMLYSVHLNLIKQINQANSGDCFASWHWITSTIAWFHYPTHPEGSHSRSISQMLLQFKTYFQATAVVLLQRKLFSGLNCSGLSCMSVGCASNLPVNWLHAVWI